MFRGRTRALFCSAGEKLRRKNPYYVLGFDPEKMDPHSVGEKEIKEAHRRLAKWYHPDNKKTGDSEKFREIQNAFEQVREAKFKYESHFSQTQAPPDGATEMSPGRYYNTPGSTKENYVGGKVQAQVRIALIWCIFVAFARFMLSKIFPDLEGIEKANALMREEMEKYQRQRNGGDSPPTLPSDVVSEENKIKQQTQQNLTAQKQPLPPPLQQQPTMMTQLKKPSKKQEEEEDNSEFVQVKTVFKK